MYHCAQYAKRQKASKKVEDSDKHRDKEAMDSFDCDGWLSITVPETSETVTVKVKHCMAHVDYCPIDLPANVIELVINCGDKTPSQVCQFAHCMFKSWMHCL
ncbi:hypothetical protein C8Q74DRAFT_1211024 [Fomes fomentarius]|nr:hypothetical protein C8Q74DRAFT_1211024 [Fomes fomentarius]